MTIDYLKEQCALLAKANHWLDLSIKRCASIHAGHIEDTDYEKMEALCSRYGRVVDILINKVFRTLDQTELLETGSLIDTVNRAEKRGLISISQARNMKDLRNRIVHEYEVEDLFELVEEVLQKTDALQQSVTKTLGYCTTKVFAGD